MPSGSPHAPLVIRFEKTGRGGKTVTLITHLKMHPEGKATLLSDLKKKIGTGGAVKDGQIELQGDQRERLPPILIALGYSVTKGN
ncbi:MAG: translation initiation factor [Elusimicrobia bacterium]|nr:translation initiation factor [Elusimicrobiota bacterium]